MNFVYAVLGGLVGLALGGPAGGLVMLIVTPLVVWQIRKSKQAEAAAPAEEAWPEMPDEAATPQGAAPMAAPAAPDLAQRVAALEHEVSALRLQVQRLSAGTVTAGVEPVPAAVPDTVLELDLEPVLEPRPVPSAAASIEPAVASIAVPVPEPVPAPVSYTHLTLPTILRV